MSLEVALDEERRQVMDMLEGKTPRAESPSRKQPKPDVQMPTLRSMLDVGVSSGPVPRHGSIAGIGVGTTAGARPLSDQTVKSMLDPIAPAGKFNPRGASSAVLSSIPARLVSSEREDGSSDAASKVPQGLPPIEDGSKKTFDQRYQFNMLPSIANQALPKRAAGGKQAKDSPGPIALAAAMAGDLESLPRFSPTKEGRHNSTVGIGNKSRSPSSRIAARSQSPSTKTTGLVGILKPTLPQNSYVTESGKVVDMDRAYRKLSNRPGPSSSFSTNNSAEFDEPARVPEDPIDGEGDEAAVESSDEEYSTDEEELNPQAYRGRRRIRRKKDSGSEVDVAKNASRPKSTLEMGKAQVSREAQSLLAAAEQERMKVAASYQVKSLLEPEISITTPAGEKFTAKKGGVYPNTSFDHPASVASSQNSSDLDGDISDIKRAQKLSINMSPLDSSVPNRVIRTILRGNFASMQEEAEEGRRRQRLYLVATDLSDTAAYALEWTIGTILRDGDTLLAMYAIDEEAGVIKSLDLDSKEALVEEGARAAQDTMKSMASQTERTKTYPIVAHNPSSLAPASYVPATESTSLRGSVDSRMMSKAEQERNHAIEDLSSTCIRLLRKTKLQVRVTIEVIHCRSPKHLVTEAIDGLEPTLVILGSRGRSALKGVLLGSFSNYLVTKSSTPVMVARKRLKKHSKSKAPIVRLANNLSTPGSPRRLSTAKVDECGKQFFA